MSDFKLTELKAWRKLHGFSQDKFAEFAKIGLNTIGKIEAGNQKVQDRIVARLNQVIHDFEMSLKKDAPVAAVPEEPPPVVATPAPIEPEVEKVKPKEVAPVTFAAVPISLSHLDLELIHRILEMTPKEKLILLKDLMG